MEVQKCVKNFFGSVLAFCLQENAVCDTMKGKGKNGKR
jgi:hypothetical protein